MRTVPAAALAVALVLLAGCSSTTAPTSSTTSLSSPPVSVTGSPATSPSVPTPTPAAVLPPPPSATSAGACPYLSADDVAAYNGEKVFGVKLDPAQDPPACFFDQYGGTQQLSVWVYRAPSAVLATAAVNRAAPVASTNPADQPSGWSGGSSGGPTGAVYAVAKGPVAVVVTTNQDQSVKARRVAEKVITALGL